MPAIRLSLLPLMILITIIAVACLISYGLISFAGDIWPYEKLISKTTQVLLILSIFPIKKVLNLSWSQIGFAPGKLFAKQLGQGLCLSIATLLPILLVLYFLDVHVWDTGREWTVGKIFGKLALGLFLALLIAVSEEILFRGLLFTALRKYSALIGAIIISSFYYASLHFLKSKTIIPFADITLISTFQLMGEAFSNWFNPAIISAWLALFVVGLFLALLRSQSRQSIGLSIGCHCGWVWQIKASKDLCNVNEHSDYLYLVSSYDGVVGPLVAFWLALAVLGFYSVKRRSFK